MENTNKESRRFADYSYEELLKSAEQIDDLRRSLGDNCWPLQAEAFETFIDIPIE